VITYGKCFKERSLAIKPHHEFGAFNAVELLFGFFLKKRTLADPYASSTCKYEYRECNESAVIA
jgi:hypothetical protein